MSPPIRQPDPDADAQARAAKAAENPLRQYFGGAGQPQQQKPPTAVQAPTPMGQVAPQSTNVGQNATQRPGPTGFTNFSRVAAANQDVSKREATAYGQRATDNAANAAQSLRTAQQQFGNQVQAGTVGAAGMGAGGAVDPNAAGLQAESTRPELGGGLTSAQMYLQGAKSYSGPAGLGEAPGAMDAATKALAAQQNLDAFGNPGGMQALVQQQSPNEGAGSSRLSGALIGQAGRANFDALRARFNPNADLTKAVTDSAAQAKAAGALSTKNAADWNALGDAKATDEEKLAAYDAAKGGSSADKAAAEKAYKTALDGLPPANLTANQQHSWDDVDPAQQEKFAQQIADGAKAYSGNGGTAQAWTGTGLSTTEIKQLIASLSPGDYARLMTVGNPNDTTDPNTHGATKGTGVQPMSRIAAFLTALKASGRGGAAPATGHTQQ